MNWTSWPDLAADLGRAIRRQREDLDLSQEHIAHEAGLSVRHYAKVEQGKANATIGTLLSIARILGLEFDALVHAAALSGKKATTTRKRR